ncbi:MAG: hypothetical protein AB1Z19_04180 [Eubacteriales bacterium]
MKIGFLPKTKLGKASVGCFVALLVLLGYFFMMVSVFGQRGGETFFSNLNLTIPMLLAWLSSLLAFVLGLISLVSGRSYSVLVMVVVLLSLFTTAYGIMVII